MVSEQEEIIASTVFVLMNFFTFFLKRVGLFYSFQMLIRVQAALINSTLLPYLILQIIKVIVYASCKL